MRSRLRLSRDLVLVGGGHAHALVLRRWGMDPLPGARLTLISPQATAPYTGMLPGYVAGHYARSELDIDLVRLCRFAGARLVLDRAVGIGEGEVALAGRPPVGFDVASLDVGIHGDVPGIPGLAEHGVPAKPLGALADRWDRFLTEAGERSACVIGGGIAGVELALAMAHRLGAGGEVAIVEASDAVLSSVGASARRALTRRLAEAGVRVLTGARVARVEADHVRLESGEAVPARLTVAAAGAVPYAWLARSGLPATDGYVRVGPTLQVEGRPGLFAAGDCAHMTHAPREKAGVYAVRQAPALAANLRAALRGLWPGLGVAPATCRTLDGLAGALRAAGLTAIPKRHGWGCATSLAGTKPIAPARGAA